MVIFQGGVIRKNITGVSTESIPFLAEAIVQHRLWPDIKAGWALLYISLAVYPKPGFCHKSLTAAYAMM
jgi:hypothetical protein